MQDLPGLVQEFRLFVDSAPAWRMVSLRRCVRACLDELAASSDEDDPIAHAERERRHAARALDDERLRDRSRRPGPGWAWRTLGTDVFTKDGALERRAVECWTPPGFEHAGALAASSQRRREAMAVALIVALHDEMVESDRGIDGGALAGEPIIDDAALERCAIDPSHQRSADAMATVEARRRAWAGLRLYAMAERVEAQSWLAGAVRFLRAAGRDDLREQARRVRPFSN